MSRPRPPFEQPTALPLAVTEAQDAIAAALARSGLPAGPADVRAAAALAVERGLVPSEPGPDEVASSVGTVVDASTFAADVTGALGQLVAELGVGPLAELLAPGSGRQRGRARSSARTRWIDLVAGVPALARGLRRTGWLTDARLLAVQKRQGLDPSQVRAEITGLAALVRRIGASSLLEIGTSDAGTFVYLANVLPAGSELVTMDITPCAYATAAHAMVPSRSRAEFLVGDSQAQPTAAAVHERWPSGFDVVFIDGDHGYGGVRADALAYVDLVRPGGILAFHDIVPSVEDRFGIRTGAWVGGVPAWWQAVRAAVPPGFEVHELVESWHQDGRGIGAVVFPGDRDANGAFLDALALTPAEPPA